MVIVNRLEVALQNERLSDDKENFTIEHEKDNTVESTNEASNGTMRCTSHHTLARKKELMSLSPLPYVEEPTKNKSGRGIKKVKKKR